MTKYTATFFSHFGATRFKKNCIAEGIDAQTKPVPRSLSTSCGTCVMYEAERPLPDKCSTDEIEAVYRVNADGTYTRTDAV